MNNIPSFSDVVPRRKRLPGRKVKMVHIFDREITVTDWDIAPSKYLDPTDGHRLIRLTLQFRLDGELLVVLTNSDVLRGQVEEFELKRGKGPFRATIIRGDDGSFKFT